MFHDQWSRVLAATIAPVVIISACALLCLAFYNRLAAIIARLRAVQRERLVLQERFNSMTSTEIERCTGLHHTTMLESLAEQTAGIERRAKLIQATLLCLLSAILALVLCSLLNGFTIVWPGGAYAAAMMFFVGMLLLFSAITCAFREMLAALEPAQLETQIVGELTGNPTAHDLIS
ncbi:MAG TPA: DUF2721 domain-containing protein [Tepidisphaeraceae bacterium]|jgi:hypothetical protein